MLPSHFPSALHGLRTPLRLAALLGVLAFASACGTTQSQGTSASYPPIETADLGEMRNVSTMGSIWFGAMPGQEDLELASRRGVERVIDLSTSEERGEYSIATACSRLELKYCSAAIRAQGPPSDESVDFVMELLAEACPARDAESGNDVRTLMVDGSGGRCASFIAIYRVLWLDVPLEEALVEARRAGMKPGASEDFVRAQVTRIDESRKLASDG